MYQRFEGWSLLLSPLLNNVLNKNSLSGSTLNGTVHRSCVSVPVLHWRSLEPFEGTRVFLLSLYLKPFVYRNRDGVCQKLFLRTSRPLLFYVKKITSIFRLNQSTITFYCKTQCLWYLELHFYSEFLIGKLKFCLGFEKYGKIVSILRQILHRDWIYKVYEEGYSFQYTKGKVWEKSSRTKNALNRVWVV